MEPKIIAQYTKTYSEIPSFQHARTVEYLLRETDGGLILTVCADAGPQRAAECVLKNTDRWTGCAILQLLYENAVEVGAVSDVVNDLCAAL